MDNEKAEMLMNLKVLMTFIVSVNQWNAATGSCNKLFKIFLK